MAKPKLVFLGTPDFAVASLDALVQDGGFDIAAVVTAPDKPAGRGGQPAQSAVKRYALAQGLPLLQPEKLKDEAFLAALSALGAQLQVVVAFRMLPEAVWAMPPLGTINLHASLLPAYRGAAPIHWAVMNGETETGVTTFQLAHEIDTGGLLLQERQPIPAHWTTGQLYAALMALGAPLVVRTARGLLAGSLASTPQPPAPEGKHAPKLTTENTRIDWARPAEALRNFIRGLSPQPTAWTDALGPGRSLRVFYAEHAPAEAPALPPGALRAWHHQGQGYVLAGTSTRPLALTDLQLEGRKRLAAAAFLPGAGLPPA